VIACCAVGAVLSWFWLVLRFFGLSCIVLACLALPFFFFFLLSCHPTLCSGPPVCFFPILSTRPGAVIVIISLGGIVPLQMAGNEFDVAKGRLVAVDVMCLLIGAIA
jgi:hypothetical protein